jgi:Tol biopolymer transport system component
VASLAAGTSQTGDSGSSVNQGSIGESLLSADGRLSVFESTARDLVAGQVDPSSSSDVFLYDRSSRTTALVSHSTAGAATAGNGGSDAARISADGRWVSFKSEASNLVPGQVDAAGMLDLFLYDTTTGAITLVTHAAGNPLAAANGEVGGNGAISDDGRFLTYDSSARDLIAAQFDGIGSYDVFLYDRVTNSNTLVSHHRTNPVQAVGDGSEPDLSGGGNVVAWTTSHQAGNIVTGAGDGASTRDVFRFDRASGQNSLVSDTAGATTNAGGGFRPRISADGRFVAFTSTSPALVAGQTDAGSDEDVFLHDADSGANALVSHIPASQTTAGSAFSFGQVLSADGRYVAFESYATDLVTGFSDRNGASPRDLYLYSRDTGAVQLVSHVPGDPATGGNGGIFGPGISADGRFVVFGSDARDLATGQSETAYNGDVFRYDRTRDLNELVSHAPGSTAAAGGIGSFEQWISADGRWVLFLYEDPGTLVPGVTNGNADYDAVVSGNLRPAASMSAAPTEGSAPLTVSFDGSASSDGDGGVTSHTWDFGDGASAPGGTTSHTYSAPGTYTAVLTVADQEGDTATASREIVAAGLGVDGTTPVLSSLSVRPSRFRALRRGASVLAAARAGTRVRYRLSEPAGVAFRVQRPRPGRRSGNRCVKPTRTNRRRRRCTRWVRVRGSFAHQGTAALNGFRFSGRLAGRRLRPRRYRLVAVATDPAGNSSAPARARFRVVRR